MRRGQNYNTTDTVPRTRLQKLPLQESIRPGRGGPWSGLNVALGTFAAKVVIERLIRTCSHSLAGIWLEDQGPGRAGGRRTLVLVDSTLTTTIPLKYTLGKQARQAERATTSHASSAPPLCGTFLPGSRTISFTNKCKHGDVHAGSPRRERRAL